MHFGHFQEKIKRLNDLPHEEDDGLEGCAQLMTYHWLVLGGLLLVNIELVRLHGLHFWPHLCCYIAHLDTDGAFATIDLLFELDTHEGEIGAFIAPW